MYGFPWQLESCELLWHGYPLSKKPFSNGLSWPLDNCWGRQALVLRILSTYHALVREDKNACQAGEKSFGFREVYRFVVGTAILTV